MWNLRVLTIGKKAHLDQSECVDKHVDMTLRIERIVRNRSQQGIELQAMALLLKVRRFVVILNILL